MHSTRPQVHAFACRFFVFPSFFDLVCTFPFPFLFFRPFFLLFLSFLPSWVFPSLVPAFLCWSVASLLRCFAPSFRPSCLLFHFWHVAFVSWYIASLMSGGARWQKVNKVNSSPPFRPERSSKALLDSPEPATLRGTRGAFRVFGR